MRAAMQRCLLMGKQTEGHAQKALESPCANLYQGSLKCKCCRWPIAGTQLGEITICWVVRLAQARMLGNTPYPASAGLEQNNYKPDKCQDAFTAYKDCKKQEVMLWTQLGSACIARVSAYASCLQVATRLERRQEAKRDKKAWF